MFQTLGALFSRSRGNFRNLEEFARRDESFVKSLKPVFPNCKPRNAGQLLLNGIGQSIIQSDSSTLARLIDALRAYLNPDQSPQAQRFWDALAADGRQLTTARLADGCVNSLWGVTPINTLQMCVAADRAVGIHAKSLVFNTYYVSSDFDIVLSGVQESIIAERPEDTYLFRWLILLWALLEYDIFNFYNDRGIIEPAGGYGSDRFGISLREMEIYRKANKRLYAYAYGADHRLREKTLALGKWTFCSECPEPGKFCVCDDSGGTEMLRTIREHSTEVIAHGLAMKIIPGARNIPYIVVDVKKLSPNPLPPVRNKFVVGHFPNHGYFKGSKYLEAAVQNLQLRGFDVDILKLSGRPHSEIIEAIGEVDVLVDQLVSGSFGLTAVEAMALGCPVICYLHAGVDIADASSCPVIQANPDTIEEVLRNLTLDRSRLSQARIEGPAYVRRNYSIESLSRHLAVLYAETAELPEKLRSELKTRSKVLESLDGQPG